MKNYKAIDDKVYMIRMDQTECASNPQIFTKFITGSNLLALHLHETMDYYSSDGVCYNFSNEVEMEEKVNEFNKGDYYIEFEQLKTDDELVTEQVKCLDLNEWENTDHIKCILSSTLSEVDDNFMATTFWDSIIPKKEFWFYEVDEVEHQLYSLEVNDNDDSE